MRNPQLNDKGELQHLLTIEGLPRETLTHILDTATSFVGVTAREVTEMEKRLSGHDVSFDPGPTDDEDYAPSVYLPSPDSDPAVAIEQSDWASSTQDRLEDALEQLDDRSRDIIAKRWLAENKATLHDLAGQYDVSAERIRQIEVSAMKKLKALMAA